MLCCEVLCYAVQCSAVRCCAVTCNAVLCRAMLCCDMPCNAVLRYAVQCCAMLSRLARMKGHDAHSCCLSTFSVQYIATTELPSSTLQARCRSPPSICLREWLACMVLYGHHIRELEHAAFLPRQDLAVGPPQNCNVAQTGHGVAGFWRVI